MKIITLLAAAVLFPAALPAQTASKFMTEGYHEFNYGQDTSKSNWVQVIQVTSPAYRSDIQGSVEVQFTAPGMTSASAKCWQQPTPQEPGEWGHDVTLTPASGLPLDAAGKGVFTFPADSFPHGPTNIRIFTTAPDGKQDLCELQLYNKGGVLWNQGIPKADPPAAKGLQLVFQDDFDGPLSISKDGRGARYSAHKPRFGDFSGWQFSDPIADGKPFSQVDTYLKIAARKEPGTKGRSGLIASVNMDGEGVWAKAPAYLECRFTAQSAIGTWPAFWTITGLDRNSGGDELDIIEAYGGVGKGNPNHPGYSIVSHFWGISKESGKKRSYSTRASMMELGGKSYWSTTFHTYAVYIGLEETVYYFDNLEVLRHPTNAVSRDNPHCFLINYAIGGISGWKIDLSRYGDGTDMYVDYVRIYAKDKLDYKLPPPTTAPAARAQAK